MSGAVPILKQHLIDPEVCIRCNTCEETCPVKAITHDSANYVVNADLCNACMACIAPCPTGSIDNWRDVLRAEAYSVAEQYTWAELPKQAAIAASEGVGQAEEARPGVADATGGGAGVGKVDPTVASQPTGIDVDEVRGSRLPPWSAAHPYVGLYTHKAPIKATVAGNYRLTSESGATDVHHVVLDFGQVPFPVLEGQSIAVIPPGTLPDGRPHHARQYSVASPRNGERPGYNNLSLTVKRVKCDASSPGIERDGLCSNYLCDVKKGDTVQVIGPFGTTFLMPNHPGSNLLMICTGTGSAPMRAMTEYRRRKRLDGATGKLMLFFGARTKEELPYFGPLMNLPKDFIDVSLAFSRAAGQPKRYVQDVLRDRAVDVAALLRDDDTYVYVCGLKGMEDGVLQALTEIANQSGLAWEPLWRKMRETGRLHFETY
jgi:benzoyl-CoA 2,3-dioxygenase component A